MEYKTSNNDYGLRQFCIHFFGALLIVSAMVLRLLLFPHLFHLHDGELVRIMIDDSLFFSGILLLFGRERVRRLLQLFNSGLTVFWQELKNVSQALQDAWSETLTSAITNSNPNTKL